MLSLLLEQIALALDGPQIRYMVVRRQAEFTAEMKETLCELDPVRWEFVSTDTAIGDLVYELYDITEEERNIIEGG